MSSLNQVITTTFSFLARSEGKDVAIFMSESNDLIADIESLGFVRHYRKGTSMETADRYSTNQFFNTETEESIFIDHGNDKEWVFVGNDCMPVTASSFYGVELQPPTGAQS